MKPLGKVKIVWSPAFAYAIGLLVTDGSLSKDRRHICFTSKDLELIEHLQRSLKISCRVSKKASGSQGLKKYFVVQIGDVNFYNFLLSIGLMPNKTKIIKDIKIPDKYFFDFLRGHFDGDGTYYSYWDPRWRSSYMLYTVFVSASREHILWLQRKVCCFLGIKGHITKSTNNSCYQLKYAKKESFIILKKLYYPSAVCLSRKLLKINRSFGIINKHKLCARVV